MVYVHPEEGVREGHVTEVQTCALVGWPSVEVESGAGNTDVRIDVQESVFTRKKIDGRAARSAAIDLDIDSDGICRGPGTVGGFSRQTVAASGDIVPGKTVRAVRVGPQKRAALEELHFRDRAAGDSNGFGSKSDIGARKKSGTLHRLGDGDVGRLVSVSSQHADVGKVQGAI